MKTVLGAGEIVYLVKHLLLQHEDLSSIAKTHQKEQGMAAHAYNPRAEETDGSLGINGQPV